jgi:hypothetical protein
MAQDALVDSQLIADGERLAARLKDSGLRFFAVFWGREVDSDRWHLYFATDDLDLKGPQAVYSEFLEETMRIAASEASMVDPLEIKLVRPKTPLVQEILKRRQPKQRRWLGSSELYAFGLESAMVYPEQLADPDRSLPVGPGGPTP